MTDVQARFTSGANYSAIALSRRSNGSAGKIIRWFTTSGILVAAIVLFQFSSLQAAEPIESDVCIYGGTVAGVAAAVQSARMGKTVVIAEFGNHIGGMTSGGL